MRNWVPNQHGAWAMLIAPVVAVANAVGWQLVHLQLLVAWLAAYCLNFFVGMTVKSWRRADRWQRYRQQQLGYAALTAILGLPLIWRRPELLWLAPAMLAAFAVNLAAIRMRQERAWINDVVGIALAILVGAAAAHLTEARVSAEVWLMLLMLGGYFAGTVWYVKTMIRERGQRGWLWLSISWHAALVPVSWLVLPGYTVVFAAATARAAALPGRNLSPKQVGVVEIGFTLAMLLVAWLQFR